MRCSRFTLKDAKRIMPKVRLPMGVTPAQFLVGLNIEREHKDVTGCSLLKTAMVAATHFRERRNYYPLLIRYVEK